MKSSRAIRIFICRICTSVFRGEVNCITATCVLVLIFFIITLSINLTRTPTVMTSLENANLNWKELAKESDNAILIEQDDGEVYIAFKMNKSSNIIKDLRDGNFALKDDQSTWRKQKRLAEDNIGEKYNLEPTYPVSVLDYPYNIKSRTVCKGVKNLSFLVVVHSATTHFMRRSSIRETWANYKLFKRHNMRIVFMLGKPEKDSTQALIEHEAIKHKDIVQGHFMDSYKNLTHKGVLGLRWISENCPQAKFIVKVDDDVFLNVFKLMEEIEMNFKNETRHIWCPVRNNGTSEIQRKKGKWKIDENEFINMTHYPVTYCNGFFAILTSDIIKEMYYAAKVTSFFWIDDVYLFGLLPDKVGNITHSKLQNLNLNEMKANDCFEAKDKKCELLVANAHTEGTMDKFWFSALQQYKTLARKYSKDDLFVSV